MNKKSSMRRRGIREGKGLLGRRALLTGSGGVLFNGPSPVALLKLFRGGAGGV